MSTAFSQHLLVDDHASRPAANAVPEGTLFACTDHGIIYQSDGVSTWSTWYAGIIETLIFAVSDETTALTAGTEKITFRLPAYTLIGLPRASLSTASSSGAVEIDINKGGSTIFSTTLTIDQSEKTSTTAATPAVVSDPDIADDDEITVDIVDEGTGAKGLKITLFVVRA